MTKKNLIFILILLILSWGNIYSQQQKPSESDIFKKTGLDHMNAGRYGEAVDMFNKYVAANPRVPEGYYLRGLCYEKRSEFFKSVEDLRHSYQLCSDSQAKERSDAERALYRVLDTWHKLLYKRIEGLKREIAIDPSNPYNYLEIGKSYKDLEKYPEAEQWYDDYLARNDNAPPDDILRFAEILSRTRHIEKGERILKKYTQRYPDDHRVWSMYGYFNNWLGRFKVAIPAFETALRIKPFFKEAQDGLDRARKEEYVDQFDPRLKQKEFPIDRYYRILKKNPSDNDTRYLLVDDLIKYERIEEAYKQLQILREAIQNDPKIEEKWNFVLGFRDTVYQQRIAQLKEKLAQNPRDKATVNRLTEYYDYIQDYSSAVTALDTFFINNPNEKDQAIRYRYAKMIAWNKDFERAVVQIDDLLKDNPNNLDYQLFKGQVLTWIPRDTAVARDLIANVLEKRPDNLEAIIAMGQIKVFYKEFDEAQLLADKAKAMEPADENVNKLQSIIDFGRLKYEEEKNLAILRKGQERVIAGDPQGAIPYYLEYMSKTEPNSIITRELADIYSSAKMYDEAKKLYDQVLSLGFDYDAAFNRAYINYTTGDSLGALIAYKQLVKEKPTEFEPRLRLGYSYLKLAMFDSVRVQTDTLLSWTTLDSAQTDQVKRLKNQLPITGLRAIFESFPSYIGLAPQAVFYADNVSFRINKIGARLELGVAQFLSLGVSFYKTRISAKSESLVQSTLDEIPNYTLDQSFTTFKGHVFLTLSQNVKLGVGLGKATSGYLGQRDDVDAFLEVKKKDVYKVQLTYQNCDAALLLYSPYLIDQRLYSQMLKGEWEYTAPTSLAFSGYYTYISSNDGNAGNDLQLRLGKKFYEYITAGYEYMYSNYKYKSINYYSPRNFESHSIFFDMNIEKTAPWKVNVGGKIGFIPYGSLISLLGYIDTSYEPSDRLKFQGKLTLASTSRDASSYKFMSIELSAFLAL